MNTKTLDQIKNDYYGQVGTPERDRLERELEALRIGFKIRSAREKKEMTQAELAERVGVDKAYISRVERGITIPSITTFSKIAAALGFAVTLKPIYG